MASAATGRGRKSAPASLGSHSRRGRGGFDHRQQWSAKAPSLVRETVEEMVDYKGQKARRSSTGGWRSAGFIIGVEIAERFVFFGIICNLITYLTGAQPLARA
ncbi:hypothetical protein Scep_020100 [Stephania cephalantha]|uniref:Uncharacterized protein n=1 Tax=Stephania cephalantha TaxID=152367 RepID=A0AAP0IC09_9MAGN